MPITTFVAMILSAVVASGLTVLAFMKWGAMTVLPVMIVLALLARWGLATVPADDGHA
ncbi:hypothetical protein [Pseudoprimorskyibacter insulae]|uniref:Uncharacterized protein n=1 Tax=Pseudoprimorskyibacter insulae TaxID=1695997 RepID=A0A2R8AVX3_9RHOB|nr:hypothetical protein [Pseudoprimorskyibacter insulae]SPF80178.1 hypothetical protein PRI8871_01984 [Pseudoprimorskyibacter insulae]